MPQKLTALESDLGEQERFVVLIACLAVILSQLANFVFTPALPAISHAFAVPPGTAQFLMTAFLGGYASVQIVAGPLADSWGRRPTLLLGMATLGIGAFLCSVSPTMPVLFAAITLQAMGAGVLPTIGRAVLLDVAGVTRMVRIFAGLGAALALLAAASPLIGASITAVAGWRVIFAVIGGLAAILFIAALPVPETRRAEMATQADAGMLDGYRNALKQPTLVFYSLMLGFTSGAMAAYFTGTPFLFVHTLGLSVHAYGLWVLLAFLPFVGGSMLVGEMVKLKLLSLSGIAILGCAISVAGTGFGYVASMRTPSLATAVAASSLFTFGLGLAIGVGKGAAMVQIRANVAASSALITFLTIVVAAIVSAVAGSLQTIEHDSLFGLLLISSLLGLGASVQAARAPDGESHP